MMDSNQADIKILIDGVFFQRYKTGIARVWRSLFEEWAKNDFGKKIMVLDRIGSAPKVNGIQYRTIPAHDYGTIPADRKMLQQVCDEEKADLFISTYYTTPISTPSIFAAYDMIPEVLGWDLNHPMWQEKHEGIRYASGYITISQNTANDLVRFFPNISPESVTVAHCGVQNIFSPAAPNDINLFRSKYWISKPYFIVVGSGGYKNTEFFLKAFSQLPSKQGFEIVATGGSGFFPEEWRQYTIGTVVHRLQLSDLELRTAYSGALALVYPSKYEGFGLPVLESLACACPVITSPNASIPEVAGNAAIYVNDTDIIGLANALCEVQKITVRKQLITAGLEQSKKFSWSNMANIISSTILNTIKKLH